jgi:hypothetical protein
MRADAIQMLSQTNFKNEICSGIYILWLSFSSLFNLYFISHFSIAQFRYIKIILPFKAVKLKPYGKEYLLTPLGYSHSYSLGLKVEF